MKIAFLHALPFDGRMWESQLDAFGAEHEVHAPTLYPLGSSFDEWALGVLQDVPGRVVAVGASMGGYTAGAIARLAPERLEAIVMVGSRADADPPERAPLREEWIRIVREQGPEGLWQAQAKAFFAPGTPEEIVERGHRVVLEQDPAALERAIVAIRDRPDSTEAVTSGVPLLVVGGDADPLIPPVVEEQLAAASPNGRVEILEGCGHLPSMERPDEFNGILSAFLASL
jgi:pimeloyl-ACP methyl ester carboxylesterase